MAGRLGASKTTIKQLEIIYINSKDNLLVIKGSVPGKSVKTNTSSLPKGKGSVPGKNVDSKFAKIIVKGSSVNKKVDSAMAKLPRK